MGLEIKQVKGTFKGFDYSTDKKDKVRQLNFIVEPENYDVKLDPNEHVEYKWVGPNEYSNINMSDEVRKPA